MYKKPVIEDVSIVPMAIDDIEFILNLKTEEPSIYWGGFSTAPDREALIEYYKESIDNQLRTHLLIKLKDESVGIISFSINEEMLCVDYSINISYRFSGLGLGVMALNKNIEFLKTKFPACKRIIVTIGEDNKRSHSIFSRAGFIITSDYEYRTLMSATNPAVVRFYIWVKEL